MKKKMGVPPYPGGRVSRQSQRMGGGLFNLFSFKKTFICNFEKYLHTMMLKLTEHVGITIFLLYKQKPRWNSDIQNFHSEILNCLNFRLFFAKKNRNFQVRHVLWRHNYVTPRPIVLILVCMDRRGPYLPIDTKINFIWGSVWKI